MATLAPPPAPPRRLGYGDDDGARRVRRKLTLIGTSLVTVLVTAWACTLGVIPAIIAIMIAKHILVAVLMMGAGVAKPKDMP
jgi:hypothetical protein